jgi:hypothetical protein
VYHRSLWNAIFLAIWPDYGIMEADGYNAHSRRAAGLEFVSSRAVIEIAYESSG